LTGASASVIRSAVMFTFIAIGITINKKSSIYNSLASSAFVLLCYDPFMLWDVGFQLSYLAVLGIVIAQPYIFKWLYIKNKFLNKAWQLASVSLAAQLFTFPVCIYYFHQLPLLFLVSNLVAIPLATLILCSCLFLVVVSPINYIAVWLGKIVFVFIWLLNHTVLFVKAIPFSLWDGISFTLPETFLLYAVVIFFLYWLLRRSMIAFKTGIGCLLIFTASISYNKWQHYQQKKIIVYNVPSHKAIDFVSGKAFQFVGDDDLKIDGVLQNFHLKPARIQLLMKTKVDSLEDLFVQNNFYQFYDKRLLLIDSAIVYKPLSKKIDVDFIVISKNPKLFIPKLAQVFNCGLYIFDASNPLWKIDKWKKDCEELHLRFHSVPELGAFVVNL
ncbi:MAG: ComEC/Rec2 family competence protein, partial [Ginsengibacter sp.]